MKPSTGPRRHLIRLADGELAETVFIPEDHRNTICVSSQVGCPLACAFCLTGQLGFVRHLSAGEIVSQVLVAQRENLGPGNPRAASKPPNTAPDDTRGVRDFYRDHFNIVLMGMGEPLHNYDNVMKALAILNDPAGLNISMSRITLSTAGLVPELKRLARERLMPNLAVSLTGATDPTRDRLMPINRTYPIGALIEVLRSFPFKPRQHVMLEYVLLRGVTDAPNQARELAKIARAVRAKVNLIPLNESPGPGFRTPGSGYRGPLPQNSARRRNPGVRSKESRGRHFGRVRPTEKEVVRFNPPDRSRSPQYLGLASMDPFRQFAIREKPSKSPFHPAETDSEVCDGRSLATLRSPRAAAQNHSNARAEGRRDQVDPQQLELSADKRRCNGSGGVH